MDDPRNNDGNNPFGDNKDDDYDPSLDPFAKDLSFSSDHSQQKSSDLKKQNNSLVEEIAIIGHGQDDGPYDYSSIPIVSSSPQQHHRLSLGGLNIQNRFLMDYDRSSLNSRNESLTSSRISLISNTSNTIVEHRSRQYSLGDGSLQKEGLLCPECILEYKTITELMEHFEREHKKKNKNQQSKPITTTTGSWSSNISPISKQIFFNESSSLVSDHIKGFLNKFLSSKQSNSSLNYFSQENNSISLNRDSIDFQHFHNEHDSSIQTKQPWYRQQQFLHPTYNWKHSMSQGAKRSHYEQFRLIRDHRIKRYVFETNKLLIRLDKLLRGYPLLTDMARRRHHEQSIVDWVDDTIVPLCPSCANKFNILTRKRHHCRLCGAVMCTKCSEFISFGFAYDLINPVRLNDSNSDNQSFTSGFVPLPQILFTNPQLHNKSGSDQQKSSTPSTLQTLMIALNNPLVDQENVDKLRLCRECKSLLMIRKEKMDVAHYKAPIVKLYEQLREQIAQIDRLVPVLFRMADSINNGVSTYQLGDAYDLKHKLTKIGEKADMLSREIQSYGIPNTSQQSESEAPSQSTISSRQITIQTSIRRSTIQYIKRNLLGLPELPNEQRFQQLKQQHAELIQKRIRFEKQLALMEQERFRLQKQEKQKTMSRILIGQNEDRISSSQPSSLSPTIDDNIQWQTSILDQEERQAILREQDPMVQQMSIIRSYIRQAKNDHRYEEVSMLKDNLKELEIEYYFSLQQQQRGLETAQ